MIEHSDWRTPRLLRIWQIVGDRKKGIEPIIPVSRSSWWAGVRSGKYPQPVKLGDRTTVWRAEDVFLLGSGVPNAPDTENDKA